MFDPCIAAIESSVGYRLAQLCRTYRQSVQDALTPLHLHVGQEMILLRLWQADNLTQSELAGDLCVQPATVTRMLARLERAGLVERYIDAHDHRVSRVCVTPAGRALEQPVHAAWQEVEAAMLADLTVMEQGLLRKLLRDAQSKLTAHRNSSTIASSGKAAFGPNIQGIVMPDSRRTSTLSDRRMLISFAHPDDEAFSCAGVIKLNQLQGIHTTLVCATKGEAGEISSPDLASPENLGLVRERELREAADHVGVDELIFLGYRDSGMAGTEANAHPNAFMNAPASAVVARLVRLIRNLRPQVVITFDPTGGYGHPDHIASNRHTTAACAVAADPNHAPELGPAWQVQRIFYPTFDRTVFDRLRDQLLAQGEEAPQWGVEEDGEIPFPDQSVDARVDIHAVVQSKWDALFSHVTQFGPDNPFKRVPKEFMLELLHEEWFELAWPDEKPTTPWSSLFEGVQEGVTVSN